MSIPFYKQRDFETTRKQELYGDNPTKRDTRRFNRYLKSDVGQKDALAFTKAESDAYLKSMDTVKEEAIQRMRNTAANFKVTPYTPTSTTETPAQSASSTPAQTVQQNPPVKPVLSSRSEAEWNRIASEATNGKLKTMEDVKKWQADNGFVGDAIDGKFGKNSLAKWAELNPDKVGTVPVIKPRVVTPKTPVTPTADQTTPLIPEGHVELSRPDGTTFLQRTTPKSDTSATTPTTKFSLDAFATANNLTDFRNFNGKRVVRYDPLGRGDWFVDEQGNSYQADGLLGTLGEQIPADDHRYNTELQRKFNTMHSRIQAAYQKQGGTMNRINYFQQGGTAPQQDTQQQVIALVQAAMQGDQKATETVNKIMEAAKAGDQQAIQIAQMIQQVAQQMQGQATAAKYGAKLNYLQALKCGGKAKAKKKEQGGKVCPECEKQLKQAKKPLITKHQQGKTLDYNKATRFYNNWSEADIRKLKIGLAGYAGYEGDVASGKVDKEMIDAVARLQGEKKVTSDGMWGHNSNTQIQLVSASTADKGSYKKTWGTEQGSLRTYDVAGQKMKDQDYYKAINDLKKQFYANPEAFWTAGGNTAKWREHLYTTPEGTAIMEEFYGATPDDVKKKLGNRVTNSKMQQAKMNSTITEGTDKVADVAVRKVLPAIALPLSGVAAPLATVTGLAGAAMGGYLGGETWNNLHAGEERYNYLTTDDMGNTAVVVRDPEQERRLQGQVFGAAIGGAAAAEGSQYLGKPGTRGMAGYRRTNNSQSAKTYRSQKRGTTGRFGKKAYLGDAETLDAQMRLGDGTYGYKHVPATPEYQAYLEGAGGNPSYTVVPIGMKNGGNFPRKKYFI